MAVESALTAAMARPMTPVEPPPEVPREFLFSPSPAASHRLPGGWGVNRFRVERATERSTLEEGGLAFWQNPELTTTSRAKFPRFCAFVVRLRSIGIRIPGLSARSQTRLFINRIKPRASEIITDLDRGSTPASLTDRQPSILTDEDERPTRDRTVEQRALIISAREEATRTSPKIGASVRLRRFWYTMGYRSRTGRSGGLLSGWWMWERFAVSLWPAFVPPDCPHGTLKIRMVIFDRPQMCLPDSNVIRTGTRVVELHCNNPKILSLARAGECMLATCRSDLAGIAAWLKRDGDEIEAVFGVTLLGAAAARLGFYRKDLPLTLRVRAERLFMNGLLALYNKDGVGRLARGKTLTASPQEIWMSRQELLRRYGADKNSPDSSRFQPIAPSSSRGHAKPELASSGPVS
jgi:hypothetical protein